MLTRAQLISDLERLGVRHGDHVMVHASLRALGPVDGGPDGVIDALEQAVGDAGTLLMILGADEVPEWTEAPPPEIAKDPKVIATAFDAATCPAFHEVGYLAEAFRRRPGTLVSDHPLGRFGARGKLAAEFTMNTPWDHYYRPGSSLERLYKGWREKSPHGRRPQYGEPSCPRQIFGPHPQ